MPSKQQLANAQKLVDEGNVVRQGKNRWHVLSSTVYEVTRTADGFVCEKLDQDDTKELCQGWKNCQGKVEDKTCKHCEAVRLTLKKCEYFDKPGECFAFQNGVGVWREEYQVCFCTHHYRKLKERDELQFVAYSPFNKNGVMGCKNDELTAHKFYKKEKEAMIAELERDNKEGNL